MCFFVCFILCRYIYICILFIQISFASSPWGWIISYAIHLLPAASFLKLVYALEHWVRTLDDMLCSPSFGNCVGWMGNDDCPDAINCIRRTKDMLLYVYGCDEYMRIVRECAQSIMADACFCDCLFLMSDCDWYDVDMNSTRPTHKHPLRKSTFYKESRGIISMFCGN